MSNRPRGPDLGSPAGCFPAGQKLGHCLYNHTDATCRFMTIGDDPADDTIVYPKAGVVMDKRSGKVTKLDGS